MLHHEGGLYMDVDDFLLPDGKGETIDQVELHTPPDGLLLPPPMCNEKNEHELPVQHQPHR